MLPLKTPPGKFDQPFSIYPVYSRHQKVSSNPPSTRLAELVYFPSPHSSSKWEGEGRNSEDISIYLLTQMFNVSNLEALLWEIFWDLGFVYGGFVKKNISIWSSESTLKIYFHILTLTFLLQEKTFKTWKTETCIHSKYTVFTVKKLKSLTKKNLLTKSSEE